MALAINSSVREESGSFPLPRAVSMAPKRSRSASASENASSASARRRVFSSVASTFDSHHAMFRANVSGRKASSAARAKERASFKRAATAAATACF